MSSAVVGWCVAYRRQCGVLVNRPGRRSWTSSALRSCDQKLELVRRCVISWDYGSSGIWLLPSKPNACQPSLGGVLSPALHADLKRWNEWAERLFNGRVIEPDEEQVARWRAMKLDLAERAQYELGEEWEVLYEVSGAWTWVRRPNPDRS